MPTGSHPNETYGTDDGKFPVANLKIEHGDFKYQTHTNAIPRESMYGIFTYIDP